MSQSLLFSQLIKNSLSNRCGIDLRDRPKREGHDEKGSNNSSKATSEHWTLNDFTYTRIGIYNNQFAVYYSLIACSKMNNIVL